MWTQSNRGQPPLVADAAAASQQARQLGFGGLLKLSADDFRAARGLTGFLHLNAAPCTHAEMTTYVMVPMVSSQAVGAPRTSVDVAKGIAVVCESLVRYERLADIPEAALALVLGAGGDRHSIEACMVSRYGRLRGWTLDNAAFQPVVLSRLRNTGHPIYLCHEASPDVPTVARHQQRTSESPYAAPTPFQR